MKRLPTFQEMRRDAQRSLADALDFLRSDWVEGHGPTAAQAKAVSEARQAIASAKNALDRAAQ
jgi:hypothetical protein